MTSKVYVGDTGTVITLDCGSDVSSATLRRVLARKPDGTLATWTASASGTNAIQYTTQGSDLDQPGTWRLQAEVTIGTGKWLGTTAVLEVHPAYG